MSTTAETPLLAPAETSEPIGKDVEVAVTTPEIVDVGGPTMPIAKPVSTVSTSTVAVATMGGAFMYLLYFVGFWYGIYLAAKCGSGIGGWLSAFIFPPFFGVYKHFNCPIKTATPSYDTGSMRISRRRKRRARRRR